MEVDEKTADAKEKITITVKEGAVTFLDVLGWKGIWEKHDDAVDRLFSLIEEITKTAKKVTDDVTGEHKELRGIETTVLSISDTIAIFTPGVAIYSLQIHAEICKIAIPESIIRMIPVRGATSFGQFSVKENVMIGPAVDEAASWHESTDWIGVILTPSAKFQVEGNFPNGWIEFSPPYKFKGFGSTGCVDWNFDSDKYEVHLTKKFYEIGPHVPEIAAKYTNTLPCIRFDGHIELR